jgi:hypothetical protein
LLGKILKFIVRDTGFLSPRLATPHFLALPGVHCPLLPIPYGLLSEKLFSQSFL